MSFNIRDYVSDDHIESIGEIAKSQSAIIQALSLENSKLEKQLQQKENIIKEVREYIENYPTLRYSSMDNSNGNRLTGKLVPTDKILEILGGENNDK